MVKLDNYTSEIRVIDCSNEIWHAQVLNQKYKWLKEGQYVRIRQATLQNHKNYSKVFGLKSHTNIMSLPYPCKIAEEMHFDEATLTKQFEMNMLTVKPEAASIICAPLAHPLIITKVAKDDDAVFTSLRQLIDGTKDIEHLCRFSVNAIVPDPYSNDDAFNFLKAYNSKTG